MYRHFTFLLICLVVAATTAVLAAGRDPFNMEPVGSWPAGYGQSIALTDDGLVLCGESGLLRVFNYAPPAAFGDEIGDLSFGGFIEEIAVDGTLAYLAVDDVGLVVVVVGDGTQPTVLAELAVPGGARSIDLAGALAAVGGEQLYLVDVSDPTAPTLVASEPFTDVRGVALDNDCCHVADAVEGYALVDVGVPAAPVVLGRHALASGLQTVSPAPVPSLVYVGTQSNGIVVLDVGDPAAIQAVGSAGAMRVSDLALVGNQLYASSSGHHLQIFSVADPAQPVLLGQTDYYWNGEGVVVDGPYAFVANRYHPGFSIVHCSDPEALVVTDYREVRGDLRWLDVDGSLVAMAGSRYYVFLDVADPARPAHLSQRDFGSFPNAVILEDGLAYCHSFGALVIYDLADPTHPMRIGLDIAYEGTDAVKVGNTIFAGVNQGVDHQYLRAFDVTDPTAPMELYTTHLAAERHVHEGLILYAQGERLLVHGHNLGAWLIDVSDPASPSVLRTYQPTTNDPLNSAAFVDHYLYLQYSFNHELRIYDLDNLADPDPIVIHPFMPYSRRTAVANGLLFNAGHYDGVSVYDVSDPLQPVLVGSFDTPGRADDVRYADGLVYVADQRMGLQVLSLDFGTVGTLTGGLEVTVVDGGHELAWRFLDASPAHQRLSAVYFGPFSSSASHDLTIHDGGQGTMSATDRSRELAGSTTVRYTLWQSENGTFWQPVSESVADAPLPAVRAVLHPAAPNPFNPSTVLAFELPRFGPVRLDVLDARGRLVRTLSSGNHAAGRHEVSWDGRDADGRSLPSGVYFSRLVTESRTETGKLTLVE